MGKRWQKWKGNGGTRGAWYAFMNRIPGGVRAALFVVLALYLWYLIAWAANIALTYIPVSFGGGGGEQVITRLPWLWNIVFLAIGLWIASITVYPSPADPEIQLPYNQSEENRLLALFDEAQKLAASDTLKLKQVRDAAAAVLKRLNEQMRDAEARASSASSVEQREESPLAERLDEQDSAGGDPRGNGGAAKEASLDPR